MNQFRLDDVLAWVAISAASKPESRWLVVVEKVPALRGFLAILAESLGTLVSQVNRANGCESVELSNGAQILLRVRHVNSGHGPALDGVAICCEADSNLIARLEPCLAARRGVMLTIVDADK